MALPQCVLCALGSVRCHIRLTTVAGGPAGWRATPWVEHGVVIRQVLDEQGRCFEALGNSSEEALDAALSFLTRRFAGDPSSRLPCTAANSHIEARNAPLRWHDSPA